MTDLDLVLESKAYIKSGVTYPTPKQLLEPVIERISKYTDKFIVRTSEQVINANEDETVNTAYGRVMIQTNFSADETDGMYKNVGLVYSLDSLKPIIKVYTGTIVSACTNMCVFNADHVFSSNLMEGTDRTYQYLNNYLTEMEKTLDSYLETKRVLVNRVYNKAKVHNIIGALMEYAVKNKYLGITAITSANQALWDNSSKYFFENESNAWTVYNAITQNITDKANILDIATKTLLLSKFFLN